MGWIGKSQPSGRQSVPVVLAVMAGFCGLYLPFTDATYVPAFIAAMVFALATPLTLFVVAPKDLLGLGGAFRWLSLASMPLAICAAVTRIR
jgi:hypothetical protein